MENRASATIILVSHLSALERNEILKWITHAIKKIENTSSRERIIRPLVPLLAKFGYHEDAVAIVPEIWDVNERASVLGDLALQLVELGYPEKAQEVAQMLVKIEINKGWELARARDLIDISISLVKSGYFEEALNTSQIINGEWNQAEALANISLEMGRMGYVKEAFIVARKIEYQHWRTEALTKLAAELEMLPINILYPLWIESLPVLTTRSRKNLLNDLIVLGPVITALGGSRAKDSLFSAIQDVGHWWPESVN